MRSDQNLPRQASNQIADSPFMPSTGIGEMSSDERLQQELLAASNEALIQRAVKGSFIYPITMLVLLLLTDWRTEYTIVGLSILGVTTVTAGIRYTYFTWLLKNPESYRHSRPRWLTDALLGPAFAYGCLAATTYKLFGLNSQTSVLTIVMVLGFAAGGTSSLAMNLRTHALFLLTLLLPMTVVGFALATSNSIAFAAFVLIYAGFLRREGIAAHTAFVRLFEKGFELRQAFSDLEVKQRELVEVNESMKLVLDNIEEGLCIVDTKGVIESQSSKTFDAWFGAAVPGTKIADQIGDSSFAQWFNLSIEMLDDGILPAEVVLDQMPKLLVHDKRHLAFTYRAIERAGKTMELLVVITDITDRIAREKAESEQRELAKLFQLFARDPSAFREFRISVDSLISAATQSSPRNEQLRALHTLKGNAGMVGIDSLAEICHELEDELSENSDTINDKQATRLRTAWKQTESRMRSIVGEREDVIELSLAEHRQFITMIREGASSRKLSAVANGWLLESVPRRLERLAMMAERVARKLGKDIQVQVDAPPLRLDNNQWRDFWMACPHLLRNSVDHGIEDRETRIARNKPATGTLALSVHLTEGEVVVRLRDDGQGIEWSSVAAKAKSLGLPCDTDEALHTALFSDGLSTREEVSATSGRGVGLSAVAQEAHRMGGTIEVLSTEGIGTEFIIRVPHHSSNIVAA